MELTTIRDFDFGAGDNIKLTPRISEVPKCVTKRDVNFIFWLLLEQEFRKRRRLPVVQIGYGLGNHQITNRTQHDGRESNSNLQAPSLTQRLLRELDPDTERIARRYAEQSLREVGIEDGLLDKLSEEQRHEMLVQLCGSSEILSGNTIRTVPEIFQALRSPSKFQNGFDITRCLGKGQFGQVYEVRSKERSKEEYAIKEIPVTINMLLEDVQMAITESTILKHLKGHKNIVELFESWLELGPDHTSDAVDNRSAYFVEDDEDAVVGGFTFYVQLELCGMNLALWKEENIRSQRSLYPRDILGIAREIFDGLAYIHDNNILHLDIKPENLVWTTPTCTHLKIVDFGLAVIGLICKEKRGSVYYAAPESKLTCKSDIYSAAVSIIEVGRSLPTKNELVNIVAKRDPGMNIPDLDELLYLSLQTDPARRPTSQVFKERLIQFPLE